VQSPVSCSPAGSLFLQLLRHGFFCVFAVVVTFKVV